MAEVPVLHRAPTSSSGQGASGTHFRPTLRELRVTTREGHSQRVYYSSRAARKGRHPLRDHQHLDDPKREIFKLRVRYEHERLELKPNLNKDISEWVAILFWFGSCVWVANGFTIFLPILRPETESESVAVAAAALAFAGGTLFEVGAYLGVLEAGNRTAETDFGSALGRLLSRPSSSAKPAFRPQTAPNIISTSPEKTPARSGLAPRPWSWFPRLALDDLGSLAALVQMFAATVFWISTLTGLPGVIPGFAQQEGSTVIVDVFFWTPQVVGGCGFVLSSLLLMIEEQPRWYALRPLRIGWQVAVWNLLGAIGFLLCGVLGYAAASSSKATYESDLWTYIGSWAFLVGSTFQWYEAIWRVPG